MGILSPSLDKTAASTRVTDKRQTEDLSARRLVLAGGVQGLGVRPAIFRLATEFGLSGTVSNSPRGVEIEIEGPHRQVASFESALRQGLPSAANISQLVSASISPRGRTGFAIVGEPSDGPLVTRVPVDRTVCPECLREINQPGDRRRTYPFTSCTLCGPRYTVIRSMPFERADTSMAEFAFCGDCLDEYQRPGDRRFHAQTTSCGRCGPKVWSVLGTETFHESEAIAAAVRGLKAGEIIALRGWGGYQLLVDATNQAAVERLRERKGRRAKPLAVMVESIEIARHLAYIDEPESAAFEDASAPIVLLRAQANNGLAAAVHPHLDTVGVMGPTTPLHAILARDFGKPLVCTSGNREGEPLQFDVEASEKQLAGIADRWLHHNRPIARPIDDSVVRVIAGRPVTIRLARGLAPLSLELPTIPPTIALGGFLKTAVAWSNGVQSVLGPHIGDQQTVGARERFLVHLKDLSRLYRFQPTQLVHDMHPEYFSTQWAQKQLLGQLAIQHHHAHVVAGMLEHGWLDRRVLGVAWDGTGYGTDGTVWGGEFLVCSKGEFERVARVRPFSLPGGEAAIHEPWRIAMSMSVQLNESFDLRRWPAWGVTTRKMESVAHYKSTALVSDYVECR